MCKKRVTSRPIFNIYNGGQNGDVFAPDGVSPTLRSGQGVVGRGIGSCNAPKLLIAYEESDTTDEHLRLQTGD